ncbi:CYTH domain-containing protein [Salegentibacter sp. HM20]
MLEIERKYLVSSNNYRQEAFKKLSFKQAYLNSHPNRSVRVRIAGEQAWLTVKGKSDAEGLSRFEWEKEIPVKEAEALLHLCEPGGIEKQRFFVKNGDLCFEVDEFFGDNQGLILAEIELQSPDQEFDKPAWLGEEVTGDKRYYNSQLSKNPFKNWKKQK